MNDGQRSRMDAVMHMTRYLVPGRISARRVKLTYTQAATPVCSLVLEVDKPSRDGTVYTGYHKVEITGKFAEACAEELEAGDEILVEGEHQYRSTVDPKTKGKDDVRFEHLGCESAGARGRPRRACELGARHDRSHIARRLLHREPAEVRPGADEGGIY